MQQALEYAEILDVPFAYSSNGDAFLEHDRTGASEPVERELPLDQFPSPDILWARYRAAKNFTDKQASVANQDYYDDGSGKRPRYYQLVAINRTVEAIARGEDRILLVMATGTGKTNTIAWTQLRLFPSGISTNGAICRRARQLILRDERWQMAGTRPRRHDKPSGAAVPPAPANYLRLEHRLLGLTQRDEHRARLRRVLLDSATGASMEATPAPEPTHPPMLIDSHHKPTAAELYAEHYRASAPRLRSVRRCALSAAATIARARRRRRPWPMSMPWSRQPSSGSNAPDKEAWRPQNRLASAAGQEVRAGRGSRRRATSKRQLQARLTRIPRPCGHPPTQEKE